MLNVSFKIFTELLANWVTEMANRVVKPSQTIFLPGKNIMEGVVVLHETIHKLCNWKKDELVLKLDFEKAYMIKSTGLSCNKQWEWRVCPWFGASVGVKLNDEIGHYFQTRMGLRPAGPLSPIIFNLVADMLAMLILERKTMAPLEVWYQIW